MMPDIAIVFDSGTDVPQEYMEKYGMYMLPLTISYEEKSYLDRVDITAEEVMARLETEIPKTSLPSMGQAHALMERIREDGYTKVIVVTISSGLSGTYNMMRLVAEDTPNMDIRLIDTKNIGIGAGITAIRAAELAAEGQSLDEIVAYLMTLIPRTKVFFCVETLKYLQKGGRIGLVTAAVGTLLGIRPIISCNDDGIYYTVHKARGSKSAVETSIRYIMKEAETAGKIRVLVAHTGVPEKAAAIVEALKEKLNCEIILAPISPALAVHTGPGLLGMGIQCE